MVSFWSQLRRRLRSSLIGLGRRASSAARRKTAFLPAILPLEERDLPSALVLASAGSSATISATLGAGVQAQRDQIGTTEIGTINRNGVASTIATPKTFPGLSVLSPTAARTFDLYSFTNAQATGVPTTVAFDSTAADPLFIAAYTGLFNPSAIGQNYLADPGASPSLGSGTLTFSFTVPAHETLDLVVNNVNAGAGVGDAYTFTITPVLSDTTATSLASSSATTAFQASVTFTATVTSAGTLASGTVTFDDGSRSIGQGTLSAAGVATFSTTALSVTASPHTISAVYHGDTNFSGSTSNSLTQVVTKGTTSTSLTASAATIAFSSSVTFTATVTSSGTLASGTVTFEDGGIPIGTATLNNSGIATFSTSTLSASLSPHTISAVYGGDEDFLPSPSNSSKLTVVAPPAPLRAGRRYNR